MLVAANGYGYRRSVAVARQQQADVIVPMHPATFPLETEAGTAVQRPALAAPAGTPQRERTAGVGGRASGMRCGWWPPNSIRRRPSRPAPPSPQRPKGCAHDHRASTLAVARWLLLITTLDAGSWSTADVLYVYRARWQVELVFKKMKQLLRLNQLADEHPARVEATVRALLVACALHGDDNAAAHPVARHRYDREGGGEQLAAARLGLDTLGQGGPPSPAPPAGPGRPDWQTARPGHAGAAGPPLAGAAPAPAPRHRDPLAAPAARASPRPPPGSQTGPTAPRSPARRPRASGLSQRRTTPPGGPCQPRGAPPEAALPAPHDADRGAVAPDDGGPPPRPRPVACNGGR